MSRRKALLIGINYTGSQHELQVCWLLWTRKAEACYNMPIHNRHYYWQMINPTACKIWIVIMLIWELLCRVAMKMCATSRASLCPEVLTRVTWSFSLTMKAPTQEAHRTRPARIFYGPWIGLSTRPITPYFCITLAMVDRSRIQVFCLFLSRGSQDWTE